MNLKMKYILFYFLPIIFSILVFSCSELNTDIPPAPIVNTHGDSVYSVTSPNYHPEIIAGSPDGMYDCQECHAADFSGGITEVACNTPNCHPTIGVHVNGIVDPSSENFHPKYLNVNNATMSSCSSCHGSDYSGGFISPSCANCHSSIGVHVDGIIDPVSENFHPKYLNVNNATMSSCSSCHGSDYSGGLISPSCASCHSTIGVHVDGIIDPVNENFHGNFIRNHNWDMRDCQTCHGNNYAGGLVAPSCLNCHTYPGGPENCTTCHGSPISNAPPQDLNGNTSTSERGVGAHQIHLKGGEVGRNLTCTECHNVPGSVYTSGHVDSERPAEVVMNNPRANTITNDPSTSEYDPNLGIFIPDPVYNSADLSCSNIYCHGYFKNGNLDNKPVWTNPSTSACGSCHGNATSPLPKTVAEGGSHPDPFGTNCSVCHGGVVDENLNIINPTKHIDGLLNLFGNDIKY